MDFTKIFAKQERSSTPDPNPSNQGLTQISLKERVGCEVVYEGEIPLKAEYIKSFYHGSALNNKW